MSCGKSILKGEVHMARTYSRARGDKARRTAWQVHQSPSSLCLAIGVIDARYRSSVGGSDVRPGGAGDNDDAAADADAMRQKPRDAAM
eukprot:4962786-Pleurochrysis_carterae.AAC.3